MLRWQISRHRLLDMCVPLSQVAMQASSVFVSAASTGLSGGGGVVVVDGAPGVSASSVRKLRVPLRAARWNAGIPERAADMAAWRGGAGTATAGRAAATDPTNRSVLMVREKTGMGNGLTQFRTSPGDNGAAPLGRQDACMVAQETSRNFNAVLFTEEQW